MRIASKPIIREFALESDEDGEARVSFCQLTYGQMQRREDYIAQQRTRHTESGEMVIEDKLNILYLRAKEIFMGMTGARGFTDEDDQPFFKFKTGDNGLDRPDYTEPAFVQRLGLLPTEVVDEMWEKLVIVNPQLKPQLPEKKDKEEETGGTEGD